MLQIKKKHIKIKKQSFHKKKNQYDLSKIPSSSLLKRSSYKLNTTLFDKLISLGDLKHSLGSQWSSLLSSEASYFKGRLPLKSKADTLSPKTYVALKHK